MTVADDLATLRDYGRLAPGGSRVYADALDRVEAEINEMRGLIQAEHAAKAATGGGPCVCKFCRT